MINPFIREGSWVATARVRMDRMWAARGRFLLNELAALLAASRAQHGATAGGLHTGPESDFLFAAPIVRLVRSFHGAE